MYLQDEVQQAPEDFNRLGFPCMMKYQGAELKARYTFESIGVNNFDTLTVGNQTQL